jgi:hypothetical protein
MPENRIAVAGETKLKACRQLTEGIPSGVHHHPALIEEQKENKKIKNEENEKNEKNR